MSYVFVDGVFRARGFGQTRIFIRCKSLCSHVVAQAVRADRARALRTVPLPGVLLWFGKRDPCLLLSVCMPVCCRLPDFMVHRGAVFGREESGSGQARPRPVAEGGRGPRRLRVVNLVDFPSGHTSCCKVGRMSLA